jgi:hypothetical protein
MMLSQVSQQMFTFYGPMLILKLTQNELFKLEALKDKRGKGASASAQWHKVKMSKSSSHRYDRPEFE